MPLGPFDADLDATTRHDLARRLRVLLVDKPLDVRAMAVALEVEPEVIVVIMRELRTRRSGRLRSTISLGHVSWWWEPHRNRKVRKSESSEAKAAEAKAAEAKASVAEPLEDKASKDQSPDAKASKKKGKHKGRKAKRKKP
ncbi:MAG: hypothetical protein M3442_01875 [Chloroflexota bacterium]|nr:hypothetical protein [Chloroflexota bacterium]